METQSFDFAPLSSELLLELLKGSHRSVFTMNEINSLNKKEEILSIINKIKEFWKLHPKSVEIKEMYLFTTNDRKQQFFLKKTSNDIVSRVLIHWGTGEEEYHLTYLKNISRGSFSLSNGSAILLPSEQSCENDIKVFSNPQITIQRGDRMVSTLRPKEYKRITFVIDFNLSANMTEFIEKMKFEKKDWENWSDTVNSINKNIEEINIEREENIQEEKDEVDLDELDAQIRIKNKLEKIKFKKVK